MKIHFDSPTNYLEIGRDAQVALMVAGCLPSSTRGNPWLEDPEWNQFRRKVGKHIENNVQFQKTGQLINDSLPEYRSTCGNWDYYNNGHDRRYQSRKEYCRYIGNADEIVRLWHELMPHQ